MFLVNFRYFSIGSNNGQIRTTRALDYEEQKELHLMVTAKDGGQNSRETVVDVTIQVEDEEDVIPVFPERLYTAQVPENEDNFLVTTVEVSLFTCLKLLY